MSSRFTILFVLLNALQSGKFMGITNFFHNLLTLPLLLSIWDGMLTSFMPDRVCANNSMIDEGWKVHARRDFNRYVEQELS